MNILKNSQKLVTILAILAFIISNGKKIFLNYISYIYYLVKFQNMENLI